MGNLFLDSETLGSIIMKIDQHMKGDGKGDW